MTRRVKGEVPLPGATERLLQATNRPGYTPAPRVVEYHAVSIQRKEGGTWRAMRLKLDTASGHMVPTLLDTWSERSDSTLTPAEALLYWAQQAVLDERDGTR